MDTCALTDKYSLFVTDFCLYPSTHFLTPLFPFLQHMIFLETNISRLPQLAALAQVRRLDQLTIHPEGNPVVSLALWRSFVIYRLHHFNLQRINGQEVRTSSLFIAVLPPLYDSFRRNKFYQYFKGIQCVFFFFCTKKYLSFKYRII